jgi:4-hydroxy-tetrahydrodipicolinate synthase
MSLPRLHGIIPPVPTPLNADETIDVPSLTKLIRHHLKSGVHGLWILGTTARFDMIPDDAQRLIAETAIAAAEGTVPMVLNVSDQGTSRTIARAKMFDDLPYDYYAVLPPWYQPMSPGETADYFTALADELSKPIVIYNPPWVSNELTFDGLRRLAEHPRIVGCKDVNPSLTRTLDWTPAERRAVGFSYLHGNDLIGLSTSLQSDGFVTTLSNLLPELAVALWDAARSGDLERTYRLQLQITRLGQAATFGPLLACVEAGMIHRGLLKRMLPRPLHSLDAAGVRRVAEHLDAVGMLPN